MKATCPLLCFILRYSVTKRHGIARNTTPSNRTPSGRSLWWVCDVTSIHVQCTYVHVWTRWPQNSAPGNEASCTHASHAIKHCMNEEPLVLPGTCGLFLGTGGAGPRALRFSAVPGKGTHVHVYNPAICIYQTSSYVPNQNWNRKWMQSKIMCNLLYNLYSCKWLYFKSKEGVEPPRAARGHTTYIDGVILCHVFH